MKKLGILALILASISFTAAIITRFIPQPLLIPLLPEGVKPLGLLLLAITCLCFAITLFLLELLNTCKK